MAVSASRSIRVGSGTLSRPIQSRDHCLTSTGFTRIWTNDHEQLRRETRDLEEPLLRVLAEYLNQENGVEWSVRQWKILLGPWLRLALQAASSYTASLHKLIELFPGEQFTVQVPRESLLTPSDTLSFLRLASSQVWQDAFVGLIANSFPKSDGLNLLLVTPTAEQMTALDSSHAYSHSRKARIHSRLGRFSSLFSRNNGPLIIDTYMRGTHEALLSLSLGQTPQIHAYYHGYGQVPRVPSVDRAALSSYIANAADEEWVGRIIGVTLPVCFLEGFRQLNQYAKSLTSRWPSDPPFILAANRYQTDEIFKIRLAGYIGRGAVYIAAQHGNNYGTRGVTSPSVEEETADYFLRWGYLCHGERDLAGPTLKTIGRLGHQRGHNSSSRRGHLLVLLGPNDRRPEVWSADAEMVQPTESLQRLLKGVDGRLSTTVVIRPHPLKGDDFEQRISEIRKATRSLRLRPSQARFWTEVRESRLAVSMYDSTSFLELLSLDYPVVCHVPDKPEELLPEAQAVYAALYRAKLFSPSCEELGEFVVSQYSNVDTWWSSPLVENAKRQARHLLASTPTHPIRRLQTLVKKAALAN